jgi:hypothetical protein
MGLVIDPTQYIIGAADVYYRAIGGTGAWTSVGATIDDIIFRVNQTMINPSDKFNGVLELVQGMDYVSKLAAECEFTLPEFAGEKLKLAMPSVTVAAGTAADTAAGWTDTLDADVAAGATEITVVAGGATAGDLMHIADGTTEEYRVIDEVAALVYSFRDPLLNAYASATATVVEADSDGKTEITPSTIRRLPDTAYNDVALVAQSPSDYYELYLYRAISKTEAMELSFGNETMAAVKATLATRANGANLTSDPTWRLRVPA